MADVEIPESFSGKLGPLPVWAWGAIIGVAVVAYVWFSNRADGTAEIDDDTTTGEGAPAGDLGDAIDGAFRPGTANGSSSADDVPESVDSNTAWGLRATQFLIGKGTSPLVAQRAILLYLDGKALTPAQVTLVDQAIRGIGQPPNPVEIPDEPAAPTPNTYTRIYRDVTGQIKGVSASGTETKISDAQYITLGMPALSSDLYPVKTHTAAGNTTTLNSIAAKYKISTERLIVINKWKTVPVIKKGSKVKVPA